MKSDASIWKTRKTLVWKQASPKTLDELKSWKRWDIVVHGANPALLKWNPDIVILTDDLAKSHAWLKTKQASQVRFILISSALVDAIETIHPFHQLGLGNVLCLEELTSMYPFLGSPWTGTVEDAIMNAAVVFRYMRIVGLAPEAAQPRLDQLQVSVKLHVELESAAPEPLTLIQQYYVPPQVKRAKELYSCLKANLECPFVDTIILCVEPNVKRDSLPPDPYGKLKLTPLKTRITYADCIRIIEKNVPKGHIVAFANADIYLDMTWQSIWSTDLHDVFLALLRWEQGAPGAHGEEPKLFGPRPDSQDTWVIHSDSVISRKWDYEALNIPFGKAGCDNAILVEFLRQKFKVVNPALSLRTIHVHQSEIRTYDKADRVNRPVYMHVDPTGIHELNPIISFDTWAPRLVDTSEPLKRPLRATTEKMLATFCSQMNRDSPTVWTPSGSNEYTPAQNQERQIDCSGGVFVSPNGLVYGYTDLYIGNTEVQKELWSKNALSHLIPAQPTHTMMAFPLESAWLDDPALYTLYYLSRVVKQDTMTPDASFWCTMGSEALLGPIKLFAWTRLQNRLIQYSEDTQVFAKRVVGRTAHSVRIMPTDIEALRSSLASGWVSMPNRSEPILVIVLDKDVVMPEIRKEGYTVRTITADAKASIWASTLSGASRVVLHTKTNAWAWLWLAPIGCKVLEIQEDRVPSDSLLHLCGAAGLEWTLLQYYRSTPEGFNRHVLAEVEKWFSDSVSKIQDKPSLPIVIIPTNTKDGFYRHDGDMFRELVEMWHEAGYVERIEHGSSKHCWLNAVGETLLYDRDNWDWLEKSTPYTKCLTGNADPSMQRDAKPWIFWGRHPRLIEKIASSGLKPMTDRADSVVFFGRIENPVQGSYRQDVDGWRSLCSKFIMPVGAKEPYPLGPEDYLKALQSSKYGLCLRGYGPKCNREIELLAMGTVPLVTPGVDYTNYIEPLIDGIHVLCVKDADDARAKMAAVSDQQLETMSKAGYLWWKRNASVKGSFNRTIKFFMGSKDFVP